MKKSLFSVASALLLLATPAANAGMLTKALLGVPAAMATGALVKHEINQHDSGAALPPKQLPQPAAYDAEQKRRFNDVQSKAANPQDIQSLPEDYRSAQCAVASTWTMLTPQQRTGYGSYRAYAESLADEGLFKPDSGNHGGIDIPSLTTLMDKLGHPSDFYPAEGNNRELTLRIADALDQGKGVFLAIDAYSSFRALSGRNPHSGLYGELEGRIAGGRHLIRVVAVRRDTAGRIKSFGLYDVNVPNGAPLSFEQLRTLLGKAPLQVMLHRGALITRNAVYAPLV